jgi:amidase
MMHGNGMGFNWEGLYTTSLLDAHANWRARANQLSRTLKISMIAGEYFIRQYRGHFTQRRRTCRACSEDLQRRAVAPRPAADADDADEGDADPAAGRAARALLPARVRDAAQHGAVRRQRPSGDERSVRHVGGVAGRHAAGRRALRGVDDLPRRARFEQLGDWRNF